MSTMYKNAHIGAGSYYNIELDRTLFICIWISYTGGYLMYDDVFLQGAGNTWEKLW